MLLETWNMESSFVELDVSSSFLHDVGSLEGLIPVARPVQVHVYSCTQHNNWYTGDRGST
jgi:hypothetical protein